MQICCKWYFIPYINILLLYLSSLILYINIVEICSQVLVVLHLSSLIPYINIVLLFDYICSWQWQCVVVWELVWLPSLAQRQTPPRTGSWWWLGCQPGSQVLPKQHLGTSRPGWATVPNKDGWPVAIRLWLAMAWSLGRAGHNHPSKHARRGCSTPKELQEGGLALAIGRPAPWG